MTIQDEVILALTCWRENRGGKPQPQAMQAVANVVLNRAKTHSTDAWTECTRAEQFSSLTAKGDPELILWPAKNDPEWQMALSLAAEAAGAGLTDLTGGATLYYAPHGQTWAARFTLPNGTVIPFPDHWQESKVVYTATVGAQVFFKSM